MHFAQANIFVACAQTLAAFNIRKTRGADGCEITPPIDYTSGVLMYVSFYCHKYCVNETDYCNSQSKEFLCDIRPRSAQLEALVRSSEFHGLNQ